MFIQLILGNSIVLITSLYLSWEIDVTIKNALLHCYIAWLHTCILFILYIFSFSYRIYPLHPQLHKQRNVTFLCNSRYVNFTPYTWYSLIQHVLDWWRIAHMVAHILWGKIYKIKDYIIFCNHICIVSLRPSVTEVSFMDWLNIFGWLQEKRCNV